MTRWIIISLGGLLSALVACSPAPPPSPPDSGLFTGANAWKGDVPVGAEQISPADFRARVASGELSLVSTASVLTETAAREQQYAL